MYKQSEIGIILNGDIADIFNLNGHGKNPLIKESLRQEVEAVGDFLFMLATRYPKAKRVFIEGNHCNRLVRYMANKAPEIYEFLNLDELIGIRLKGFEFISYKPPQQFKVPGTNLIVRHEGISNGENATSLTLKKGGTSMIFGHTHRVGYATMTLFDGTVIRAINNGWLGDKNSEVFSYIKGFHAWQQAFTEVTVLDGEWYEQLCLIHDNGKEYTVKFDNNIWSN